MPLSIALVIDFALDVLRKPLGDLPNAKGPDIVCIAAADIDSRVHRHNSDDAEVEQRQDGILNKCPSGLVKISTNL